MTLYVARDRNRRLYLYLNKPDKDIKRGTFQNVFTDDVAECDFMEIPHIYFESVTWDNSPVKVTLNLLEWPEQNK